MGGGADRLGIAASEFAGPTALLGGDGTDPLREEGNTFRGRFFENFEL
jgi:hypothetical protein